MKTRGVHLDEEAERILDEVCRATGMSASVALKRGLIELRKEMVREESTSPYDIYEQLDLEPGGYSTESACETKRAVRDAIKRKLGR